MSFGAIESSSKLFLIHDFRTKRKEEEPISVAIQELMSADLPDDNTLLSQDERDKTITMYEKFINERLKVDMDTILQGRDKIYEELSAYLELKQNMKLMQEQNLYELTSMINLGSEFYAQAKVPDTSYVFVKIGLGFHAEMTMDEASVFIDKMEVHLNAKADIITKKAEDIQVQIHAVQDALQQLMNLPTIETMLENPAVRRKF